MEDSESKSNNSIAVDNAKLTTSVTFINICFALSLFLKKFQTDAPLDKSLNLLLSISIFLFTASALLSFTSMAKKSYNDYEIKTEVFSAKFAAYLFGIIVFGTASLLVLTGK